MRPARSACKKWKARAFTNRFWAERPLPTKYCRLESIIYSSFRPISILPERRLKLRECRTTSRVWPGHFGSRVYNMVIPRTVRLSEAPSFGKSILEYDPSGAGASAYRALAREFIRRHAPAAIARETEKTHLLESLDK